MSQHSWRSLSPRPFCSRGNVWIDSSCISHIVDPSTEKGFHRCSKIESDHTSCYRSHTGCLHTSRWSLVGRLRVFGDAIALLIALVIAAGSDSSLHTGAGRHRISWRLEENRGCICGREGLWVLRSRSCAWRCHKRVLVVSEHLGKQSGGYNARSYSSNSRKF
jgi:hypothetical protein